jgi:hypothetical protein
MEDKKNKDIDLKKAEKQGLSLPDILGGYDV